MRVRAEHRGYETRDEREDPADPVAGLRTLAFNAAIDRLREIDPSNPELTYLAPPNWVPTQDAVDRVNNAIAAALAAKQADILPVEPSTGRPTWPQSERDVGISPGPDDASQTGYKMGILREASTGSGNFTIPGVVSRAEVMELGEAFVGPGYRVSQSDGTTLISSDKLRQFRPPSAKPNSPFTKTGTQANFQSRGIPSGYFTNNGHLDVK